MFKILIILSGFYNGLSFDGYISSDFTFNTKQECIIALSTDEVKADIDKIMKRLSVRGYNKLIIHSTECIPEGKDA